MVLIYKSVALFSALRRDSTAGTTPFSMIPHFRTTAAPYTGWTRPPHPMRSAVTRLEEQVVSNRTTRLRCATLWMYVVTGGRSATQSRPMRDAHRPAVYRPLCVITRPVHQRPRRDELRRGSLYFSPLSGAKRLRAMSGVFAARPAVFLDSRRAGLLRVTGIGCQFRHDTYRHWLVAGASDLATSDGGRADDPDR